MGGDRGEAVATPLIKRRAPAYLPLSALPLDVSQFSPQGAPSKLGRVSCRNVRKARILPIVRRASG